MPQGIVHSTRLGKATIGGPCGDPVATIRVRATTATNGSHAGGIGAQSAGSDRTHANGDRPARTQADFVRCYYGVQTARALENFQISGTLINQYPGFVEVGRSSSLAAARANTEVGAMKKERLALIEKAADAVIKGQYHDSSRLTGIRAARARRPT
jgi:aspartate ammonia-lyase